MNYGGMSAKVRAMYGKRLTRADFDKLIQSKSVSDIAAYLKSLPAWTEALRHILPATVHRAELERAIRNEIMLEYMRLYKFASRNDQALLRYFIRRRELNEITMFLRLLLTGQAAAYVCTFEPFYREHIHIRFESLSQCRTFDEFLEGIRGSIYHDTLAMLPRKQGEAPDLTIAKSALSGRYYAEGLRIIKRNYSGEVADLLIASNGARVDLMNIEILLRIKRYYPQMSPRAAEYLVPYKYKLSGDFFRSMAEAPTADDAIEMVKNSPYAKVFTNYRFANLEDYILRFTYDTDRKLLHRAEPSVITPIAYIGLKEIEVRNLINVIECVRYGDTPESASIYIPGM